jgi:hypothetical protein
MVMVLYYFVHSWSTDSWPPVELARLAGIGLGLFEILMQTFIGAIRSKSHVLFRAYFQLGLLLLVMQLCLLSDLIHLAQFSKYKLTQEHEISCHAKTLGQYGTQHINNSAAQ